MTRLVSGLVCAVVVAGFSGTADASSGWTTWGGITSFQDYGLGAEVETNAPVIKPSACVGSRYRISSTLSEVAKDRLSRALLAAYMAGKSVRLKVDDVCTTDNMPSYYAVDIAP